MAGSTISEYVQRRRRARGAWVAYAIGIALLATRAAFEFAFDGWTEHIVSWLSSVTHGNVMAMASAGWLTVALLPFAVATFLRDRRSRLGTPDAASTARHAADTGVIYLTERPRSAQGHKVARRSIGRQIRRSPQALTFAAALLFWPITGASMARGWITVPSGDAFVNAWRISLAATALGVLALLAEPWITPRWRLTILVALPTIALATALLIA